MHIDNLVLLSRFHKHAKTYRQFKRAHVLTFLQSYRRGLDDDSWISTYNAKTITALKFFKWLYNPALSRQELKKAKKPEVVRDLPLFTPKESTTVQATDLWTPPEDKVFLKYCPDVRLCLYHALSDDTSGRPHELLAKRFVDVKIKQFNGKIYGELEIGRGGKTKSRTVPLIISIPYFKQWQGQNSDPNAFMFRAFSPQAKFKNRPLSGTALNHLYWRMKDFFKSLLERTDVPAEDKEVITGMLEKPWNPYIRRHTSLTEKARLLKSDYSLRLHAGWTKNSKMAAVYTHELGGESSREILAAAGIIPRDADNKSDLVMPKECPNCREPNKPDARFCASPKCGFPLTFDGFTELKEQEQQKEGRYEKLQEQTALMMQYMMEADPAKKAETSRKLIEKGYMPKSG